MEIHSDTLIEQAAGPRGGKPEQQERPAEDASKSMKNAEGENAKSKEVIEEALKVERYLHRDLRLEIESETNMVIAKIVDRESGEVIRQIPPEEMVEISKRLKQIGLLISRVA